MAPIHETRLAANSYCFCNTGVDYFGPFIALNGRKTEKRYGVVFTCATTRAIHLEVSYDMTTNSFINTIRRFMSRRGNIQTLTSDNGSNLRGAELSVNCELFWRLGIKPISRNGYSSTTWTGSSIRSVHRTLDPSGSVKSEL